MKPMLRNEIITIAINIFNSGDIIAKHGTSIKNAQSIINTGFNYNRTSFVIQSNKSIESLCGYGWKENGPDDSANIIIEIPREFIMDLLSMNISEYQKWIKKTIDSGELESIINSLTTFEYKPVQETNSKFSLFNPPLLNNFSASIPKEFIVGAFIWCNGKTYFNLKEGENALDNLTFVPNDNYYLNVKQEDKEKFIKKMRLKLGIEIDSVKER